MRNSITGCLLALRDTFRISYVTLIAPAGRRLVFDAIQAALVLALPPATCSALLVFGGVMGKWAWSIFAGVWHVVQVESSGSAPPPCARPLKLVVSVNPSSASAMVTPAPVAKLMPSWHPPQASRLGTFFQLSPCAVGAVDVAEPSWHLVQFRKSCGN